MCLIIKYPAVKVVLGVRMNLYVKDRRIVMFVKFSYKKWVQDFLCPSRPLLWPTQPPAEWVQGVCPQGLSSRGMELTTYPSLAPRLRKSRAIHILPLWASWPVPG